MAPVASNKNKKKWSKGKTKDKVNNAITFDAPTLEKVKKEIPAYKLITPSILVDRLKINGSLARRALRDLHANGSIKLISSHGSQLIYTRTVAAAAAEEAAPVEVKKGKK
ncbi:40S ribosomal protein S25 [Zancudomyces culisetae]|uniref:40S ribosomal protein S25 n=1 Tax=Zancudomyces culisetae TaxID=1213189 RepID=A0A1R1PYB2_ZANCU|nr:40S ribosomal protein S25 [Zancudomyces culisetae]|eukprot:OMH85942.1 40S ribosomal protein S25 [Zancudomyces culisetae]